MAGIGLLVGFICAFLCGMVAESKGRNGLAWGVIGFFFGLIGLLIIAVIEPVREPQVIVKERTVVKEPKPVKKLETKAFINRSYSETDFFAVSGIKFIEDDALSVQINIRSYSQTIRHLKADLILTDTFGDDNRLEQVVFDFDEAFEDGWSQSMPVKLWANQVIAMKHIRLASVIPISTIDTENQQRGVAPGWTVIENADSVREARRAFGGDAFVPYEELGSGYRCVCGKVNDGETCSRCGRQKARIAKGDMSDGFLEELRTCKTYKDAAEVYERYEDVLNRDMAEAFKKRLDKDIYIKKMYSGSDFGDKIEEYARLITSHAG